MYIEAEKSLVRLIGTLRSCRDTNWRWHPQNHRLPYGAAYSEWFLVSAGVIQGGVLSPEFYSIYVDDLIGKLISLDKGCYVLGIFTAALFHADDMAILAPSMKGLMALLTVCDEYCVDWDVCLNAKKSKILSSGRKVEMAQDVVLNGNKIDMGGMPHG